MSNFTEPLVVTPTATGTKWMTQRDLSFEIGLKGSGLIVKVPSGTKTDFATMPRVLWTIMPPHDARFAAAFVLHDHLCRWVGFSRVVADAILYDALRVLGASLFRAWAVYAAVSAWRILRGK
jgi:hypothetical protein